MTPGSGLFILLFLFGSHCPHFIYYGDEGALNDLERINIPTNRNEQIRFGDIFRHIGWNEYKNNFHPQRREQRLVVLDVSASLAAHEQLTSELAKFLKHGGRVYVTLIRLGGEDCEGMLGDLRKTNRSAHKHLKLMYTCHREATNGTQTKLNYNLLLVDAHLPENTDARTLNSHKEEEGVITIFSNDLANNENSRSASIFNNPILEEYEVCSRKCKLYCANDGEASPSYMTTGAFYKISNPVFGDTICLNCTRVQQHKTRSPSDSNLILMCHSGFEFQLWVTIVVTILFGGLLYALKFRLDKLKSHTQLNDRESAEMQWIIKQGAELLVHMFCWYWNLWCSCHPNSSTVSLRYDEIAQALISWLFMAANVIIPYLSFFSWPPGAWIYFVAFATALTGFVIQVVVIYGIDLESLTDTSCSLTGRELSIILVFSTSWGAIAILCLCALVIVPPIVARYYYGKSPQRKSYVICGAELAIVAICELPSTISVTMKNVALGDKSLLADSQVSLATRLIITLAAIAYYYLQDCCISGDETADRGTQTSDDDVANGGTRPSPEFKPAARRTISVHMQTLINKFEQQS